ncbi:MAG TPA: ankyrin repeat domain-containing protein [Bryobacteraceae bacterium]|nr:ankyrin repeat domain-containing protein [Bryobacteraceae bacterium]
MSLEGELLAAFEVHSPEKIRAVLERGQSPIEPIKGKTPMECLIEMYLRSSQFRDCVRVMLEAGAVIEDPVMQAVLLDDVVTLRQLMKRPGFKTERKFDLDCTFTPLKGATALHICAEYNSLKCAAALIKAGANVNARAAFDADGFGGHTPIFHTVNSHNNYSRPMMELLAKLGAKLDLRLKGLVWGSGFAWETVLFDVTLLSYTQCGLLKQFQRREVDIYSNLAYLYEKLNGTKAPVRNVPNRYLRA